MRLITQSTTHWFEIRNDITRNFVYIKGYAQKDNKIWIINGFYNNFRNSWRKWKWINSDDKNDITLYYYL